MNCYRCKINKANSQEHIIPAWTGCTLAAKILCKDCNNTFGHEIDAALANSFACFRSFFPDSQSSHKPFQYSVVGDSNIKVATTKNGLETRYKKPCINEEKDVYLTKDSLLKYLRTKNVSVESNTINNPILCAAIDKIGGLDYWLAIFKIALNFAFYKNIIPPALDYVIKNTNISVYFLIYKSLTSQYS